MYIVSLNIIIATTFSVQPRPHGMGQYPNGPQGANPTQSPPHAIPNGMNPKSTSGGQPATETPTKPSSAAPPNGSTSANHTANGGGGGGGTSSTLKAPSNGLTPNKVQFKTYTTQKNARAVGSTMAYKHPPRSHYGQPDAKLRDPKFTNPQTLLSTQRWELLESAKRWLPGEGTLITWKKHRYLIGPPIHMGMNGHIHYCYKVSVSVFAH